MSTQVPSEWAYASNGPNKEYLLGRNIIRFKRTARKDITKLSYKAALLVQAIKAIGKDRLDSEYIKKIARLMTEDEKSAILADGQYMTGWVYDAVKKTCNREAIR